MVGFRNIDGELGLSLTKQLSYYKKIVGFDGLKIKLGNNN